MVSEIEKVQAEYLDTFSNQHFIPKDLEYTILEKHLKFLEKLNIIENSAISVFDLYQNRHIYLSPRFETIFGFSIDKADEEGNEYFDKKVHPDDALDAMKIASYFINAAFALPLEEKKITN